MGLDTSFMVFNRVTYRNMVAAFEQAGVDMEAASPGSLLRSATSSTPTSSTRSTISSASRTMCSGLGWTCPCDIWSVDCILGGLMRQNAAQSVLLKSGLGVAAHALLVLQRGISSSRFIMDGGLWVFWSYLKNQHRQVARCLQFFRAGDGSDDCC